MRDWSGWRPIEAPSGHRGAATYQIRLVSGPLPVSLPRLLGPDADGILVIGETGRLEKRREQFCRGRARGDGHSEANLIWLLESAGVVQRLFAATAIEYRFRALASKDAAAILEKAELWRYVQRFGEVPPFNSSFPGRESLIDEYQRSVRRGAS